MRALEGIRVLDLTRVISGPYCTMYLADHGAEVIKVEAPDWSSRAMGPAPTGRDGLGFIAVNRNKRSVVIDLQTPEGVEILLDLVATADVLVENFRPGVMARLGLGWDVVHERNPALVYASISGFGQYGPDSQRPGYDLLAQAMSGLMSATGEPGGAPVKCGPPIADLTAGMFAGMAILTALLARGKTGEGQYVETSLLDSAVALSVWESVELWGHHRVPQPLGSAHRASAPYQAIRTADGHMVIAANNDAFFAKLCKELDRTELIDDERFDTNPNRMANLPALISEIESVTVQENSADLTARLVAAGVPGGEIRTYDEVLDDEHLKVREMIVEVEHPVEGTIKALGTPAKLYGTPAEVKTSAPLFGADTRSVLERLGYSAERVDELRVNHVVFENRDLDAPKDGAGPSKTAEQPQQEKTENI